jgi:hypothetical protein
VRRTDAEAVRSVIAGFVVRITAGLSGACFALDDDAATELRRRIDLVHDALATLGDADLRGEWIRALTNVAMAGSTPGLIAGRAVRLLRDAGDLDPESTELALSQALSRGEDPARGAAWIEGFLSGDAFVMLNDRSLLRIVDHWVAEVPEAVFDDLVPLLRRTFASLSAVERRDVAEIVLRGTQPTAASTAIPIDSTGAERAVDRLLALWGVR